MKLPPAAPTSFSLSYFFFLFAPTLGRLPEATNLHLESPAAGGLCSVVPRCAGAGLLDGSALPLASLCRSRRVYTTIVYLHGRLYFFLPAMGLALPLRVLALFLVRWPRHGRLCTTQHKCQGEAAGSRRHFAARVQPGGAAAYVVVAAAAVAADLLEPLDVELGVAAEVALGGVLVHLLAQPRQLLLRQVLGALGLDGLRRRGGGRGAGAGVRGEEAGFGKAGVGRARGGRGGGGAAGRSRCRAGWPWRWCARCRKCTGGRTPRTSGWGSPRRPRAPPQS